MSRSQFGVFRVGAKTAEVADYHRAPEKPGKPLHLLIPGGLIAMTSLAMMIWVTNLTWYEATLAKGEGVVFLLLIFPVYVGSVFLFSYSYELYDIPRALRLTAILVFFSVAAVVILAVLLALLDKDGSGSSSASDGSGSSGSSSGSGGGYVDIDLGGSQTVTRDVVREVPAGSVPFSCSYCGVSFVPMAGALRCPSCGASQPLEAAGGDL